MRALRAADHVHCPEWTSIHADTLAHNSAERYSGTRFRRFPVSLISRLRAVVAGDDYLDGDYDELDYDTGEHDDAVSREGLTMLTGGVGSPNCVTLKSQLNF